MNYFILPSMSLACSSKSGAFKEQYCKILGTQKVVNKTKNVSLSENSARNS